MYTGHRFYSHTEHHTPASYAPPALTIASLAKYTFSETSVLPTVAIHSLLGTQTTSSPPKKTHRLSRGCRKRSLRRPSTWARRPQARPKSGRRERPILYSGDPVGFQGHRRVPLLARPSQLAREKGGNDKESRPTATKTRAVVIPNPHWLHAHSVYAEITELRVRADFCRS